MIRFLFPHFSDFFPVIIGFLRRLPVIGNILSAPGISKVSIRPNDHSKESVMAFF